MFQIATTATLVNGSTIHALTPADHTSLQRNVAKQKIRKCGWPFSAMLTIMRFLGTHRTAIAAFGIVAGSLVISGSASAKPQADPIVGARFLALSPDGSKIAFSYLGDVWVASSDGGRAIPITNNVEMDDRPVWSPDGKQIAFTSNRFGNNEIFVVDADGGKPKRITYHSGGDIPSGWTPDGKALVFKATRDSSSNGVYTIDVKTGAFKQHFLDSVSIDEPKLSPEGDKVVYTRFGFPWSRARYQGSNAAQLWVFDLKTAKRQQLRNNGFQHLWPQYTQNGIYVVTMTEKVASSSFLNKPIGRVNFTVGGTPNVYQVDLKGNAKRLTNFSGQGTRFLTSSADGKTVAFERDGVVYKMAPGGEPKPISLTASTDDKVSTEERLVLTSGARSFTISPDLSTVIFDVRSEIWSVPVKKGDGPNRDDAAQLTDWVGSDTEPVYAPDGKSVFFVSDRNGAERLYRMEVDTKKISAVTSADADISQLRLTPDKKFLTFFQKGKNGGVYRVSVAGGEPQRIVVRPGASDVEYEVSPDGRYVAYVDILPESGYYYWESGQNIYIVDTTTGESRDVTMLNARHSSPTWSPDGKYLFFGSNRNGEGLYVLPFQKEDERENVIKLKYEKPKDPVKVEIDWDDIESRARRISGASVNGMVIDPEDGSIYYRSGGELFKADFNAENARRVAGGVRSFELVDGGKQMAALVGDSIALINVKNPNFPQNTIGFRADWTRDLHQERRAAFQQFWREYNRGFYDANFHGRDWVGLRNTYEKFLGSVGHRNEFATVLNMMVGELEASHAEVGPAFGNPRGESSAHLGFTFDYSYSGPGIKIKEVPAKTPGAYAKTKLNPGEIVTKINGKEASISEGLYRDLLNEQAGREVTLTVKGADGKEREVKYRLISGGEFGGIVFNNLLEKRRKYVEEKSGGKLTYVHISGMGGPQFDRFVQQLWAFGRNKQGLIIDVRNNGGGNTSDRIIDILERRQNSFYQPRDESPIKGPGQTWEMPIVVMHAESSFSNAEMFPYAMRARKLAKLVGKPTPGYVIYTYGLPLVDGTSARMPSTGVFRMDGSPLENMGEEPDFEVEISPEQYFAGQDPQLDKAIEVLLKK